MIYKTGVQVVQIFGEGRTGIEVSKGKCSKTTVTEKFRKKVTPPPGINGHRVAKKLAKIS